MVSPLKDGPNDGKNKGVHFPSVFSCFYTKIKIFESVLEDNGFFVHFWIGVSEQI